MTCRPTKRAERINTLRVGAFQLPNPVPFRLPRACEAEDPRDEPANKARRCAGPLIGLLIEHEGLQQQIVLPHHTR